MTLLPGIYHILSMDKQDGIISSPDVISMQFVGLFGLRRIGFCNSTWVHVASGAGCASIRFGGIPFSTVPEYAQYVLSNPRPFA